MKATGGLGVGGEFATAIAYLASEFEIIADVVLEIVGIHKIFSGVVRWINVNELHSAGV
jgi:hypothetical protein